MKINTDGVLLGAMAMPTTSPHRILDIGTGTGVIALMLAQRYANGLVDAVEIDSIAAQCTQQNFKNAPFADRLRLFEGSFEEMKQTVHYDWIVSNPPFYTNSLHNPDERKRTAKHTDIAFFQRLLSFATTSLTEYGELHLILPPALAADVTTLAGEAGLSPTQRISIRSYPDSEVIRQIVGFRKNSVASPQETDFIIYEQPQQHSAAYRSVLQPFFLAF